MTIYKIEFKPRAIKDLHNLKEKAASAILAKIERMKYNLHGDIKKLKNFEPPYRLRMADYRALFDLQGDKITIYRILHRKDAYK